MNLRRSVILFLSLFLIKADILAQEDSTILAPIVITATRTKTRIDRTPAAVSYLTAEQIREQNGRSVPELLMSMAGVWMQKTNHAGGSPFLRGLTGNQVLLMTDGIRLNNATYRFGPNQYLSTIDPFTVNNVEAFRGVGGTLYGSDAIGGVINITTTEPSFSDKKNEVHGSLSAKWMSRSMEKTLSTSLSYSTKKLAWEVRGSFSDFGDIYAANKKKQSPTSYNQQSFYTKIRYRIANNQELIACFQQLVQKDVDLYDQVTQRGFAISKIDPQKRQMFYVRWEAGMKTALSDQFRLTASRQVSTERRVRQRRQSVVVNYEYDHVVTYGLQAEMEKKIRKNWRMITGIDVYADDVESSAFDQNTQTSVLTPKRGLYATGSTMLALSAFHNQQFALGKFDLVAGLRANQYSVNIPDPLFGDVSLQPFALAGNAGMLYHLSGQWKLTGSLSTGYRTPNVNDLSSFGRFDFGTEVPSPNLKPERSFNKEVGVKWTTKKSFAHVTFYHNSLNDLIDRVKSSYEGDTLVNGDRVYQKVNRGKAVIYGMEAEFYTRIYKSFGIRSHLTYTYGQNKTANEPVRRIPPVFGRLSGEYQKKGIFAAVDWIFAGTQDRLAGGDRSDHRINPKGTPGYGIVSLRTGYQFKFINAEAGIENMLDQAYRMHGSGIDGYGRHMWIRTTFKF
jgi:outer membrane cobalamin receptor